jgi:hypothetical protein
MSGYCAGADSYCAGAALTSPALVRVFPLIFYARCGEVSCSYNSVERDRTTSHLRHKTLGFSGKNSIYQVDQQAGVKRTSLTHSTKKWSLLKKILLPDDGEGARISVFWAVGEAHVRK